MRILDERGVASNSGNWESFGGWRVAKGCDGWCGVSKGSKAPANDLLA